LQVTQEELKRYEELQFLALDFARQGQTSELKAMLEAKMPINLSDHKGNSLLMLAAYHGNEETTLMLLQMGACVDQKNDRGQTPLAGVCFKGYFNIVKLLVQAGANIHENNGLGTTPLFFASMFGHKQIVQYLNEQTKSVNFKSKLLMWFSSFIALFRKNKMH
jgi:ankyrin repeat protein